MVHRRDRIFVRTLEVPCIVGILPRERTTEQPLIVDVDMGVDFDAAAHGGHLDGTVDYARVADEVAALLRFRRYELVEMAADELAAMLFGVHPKIVDVRLRLTKPDALKGRAAGVGVEVHRHAHELLRAREGHEFGEIELLYENQQARLYLLHIEPGCELPERDTSLRELEWPALGVLERDDELIESFAPVVGSQHRYRNVGKGRASLFCCDLLAKAPS